MGRLIDEDILIDSIPDLSVFEQEDFGTPDMIRLIEDAPTVQAIPKADYENRLKADMVAMLTDMLIDVEEIASREQWCDYANDNCISRYDVEDLFQQKINALKGETDDK